ncbi:MAG TPA: sigma-54 dependent transcriptional regulator [Gemmatimonadales bacterium]|nr:sigma-54 dependent transcriptional regulator [Gemmatimonadales bacterium]
MTRVLIVDDVRPLAEQYAYDLKRLADFEAAIADGGDAALARLAQNDIDCVLLDLEMPGMDGFQVLQALQHRGIEVPVIVYTGTGNFDRCIQALRLGAYGFIDKAEPMERVVHEIETTLERRRLRLEVMRLQERVGESSLVGSSQPIQQLKAAVRQLAPIPSTVLILGESGTGKELVARDLHRLGAHPSAPFVAINCAALPEQLVESELFGHERGAFTGAIATRRGAFEAAEQGTLFLDEVGELPLAAQAKLLRVLEDHRVVRVGSTRPVDVHARVVAATNRDLDAEVREGRFREDLLYRLNAHVIQVPPLRDRASDIGAIADRFLADICERFGVLRKRLSGEALEVLMAHDWKRNNVRELRNVLERMVIAADGEALRAEHVPEEIRSPGATRPPGTSFQDRKTEAERRIILSALEEHEWQITRTAEALGLADHASLLKIMRRLEIRRSDG